MMDLKDIQLNREKMPTAITANNHPIHKWYNFVAGYSPEYVYSTIKKFEGRTGYSPIRIYDPFAGCATTNVVANTMNIPSLGIERNPIFYKLGLAKVNAKTVVKYIAEIAEDFEATVNLNHCLQNIIKLPVDAEKFLSKLFIEESLEILLELRNTVNDYVGDKNLAGFIFLSKVIDYVTHSKTDGIYKAPTSKKQYRTVLDSIRIVRDLFLEDISSINEHENMCELKFASSVDYPVESESLDLVVFSPPYLNNFDFAEMTRMQMYFWGEAGSWKEISDKHRNHMIVNTTTALKLVRKQESQDVLAQKLPPSLQKLLQPIVAELKTIKKTKPSKKDYDLIIYPYLAQMKEVLTHCYNGLRKNGEIHIVVSDAAFYGIHIDTQEFLAEILKDIGFRDVSVDQMRARGERWILEKRKSSGKQLGEYEITGVKE